MRKLMIALGATTAALVAVPAAAKHGDDGRDRYGYGYQNQNLAQTIDRRIDRLGQRIQRAAQRNTISRNEERRLVEELRRIDYLNDRYRQNGLSQREAYDLQQRLERLQQQIREDRKDGRRYNDGRYDDGRYGDDD